LILTASLTGCENYGNKAIVKWDNAILTGNVCGSKKRFNMQNHSRQDLGGVLLNHHFAIKHIP